MRHTLLRNTTPQPDKIPAAGTLPAAGKKFFPDKNDAAGCGSVSFGAKHFFRAKMQPGRYPGCIHPNTELWLALYKNSPAAVFPAGMPTGIMMVITLSCRIIPQIPVQIEPDCGFCRTGLSRNNLHTT